MRYSCENGTSLTLQVENRNQISIAAGSSSPVLLSEETNDKSVLIFGNAEAVTFVSGYGKQIIETNRTRSEPSSTICNPTSAQ